jgi:hypothetical protein
MELILGYINKLTIYMYPCTESYKHPQIYFQEKYIFSYLSRPDLKSTSK